MRLAGRLIGGVWRLFRLKSEPPLTEYAVALMSANCTLKIDRACQELNYNPIISVAEGLARME
jgi:nucleoside-diphosphate-sugar epimerase